MCMVELILATPNIFNKYRITDCCHWAGAKHMFLQLLAMNKSLLHENGSLSPASPAGIQKSPFHLFCTAK